MVCLVGCLFAAGCRDEGAIIEYSVAKEPVPPVPAAPAPVVPQKMLGAIVPAGETTWFFKLTGPVAAAEKEMENFLKLILSVKFDGEGRPDWTLPEGWTREEGSAMRFATLKSSGSEPLETSVSSLPGDGMKDEYVLSNVNRWRGQLGLKPVTVETLYNTSSKSEETRKLDVEGRQVVLVNLVGKPKPGGMGSAPFAGMAEGAGRSDGAGKAEQIAAAGGGSKEGGIKYDTPAGWKPGKESQFRKAAFVVTKGEASVEITVTSFPVQGVIGDPLANVNRWREQMGLPATTEEKLKEEATPLVMGGAKGMQVELIGAGKSAGQSLFGAMAVRNDTVWFVKLQGDAAVAAAEKERFGAFVKSIRFE